MKITLTTDDGSWTESLVLSRADLSLAELHDRLLSPGGTRLLEALQRVFNVDEAESCTILDYAQNRWESRRQRDQTAAMTHNSTAVG
ncbi:MAG TPA: hypothetical protein VGE52_06070 [Pirellulales bacterium]